jgi:hypothetical protein
MPERLFVFIQLEFPWDLGPPDGRYLLRGRPDDEAEHVVVINTLGAARTGGRRRPAGAGRHRSPLLARLGWRGAGPPATAEPASVPTTRVTVIDPLPLAAGHQAETWLADLDRDREVAAAVAVVNRVVHLHRIASADPYTHEVCTEQALVIRAGWGEGEQVADGRWLQARELPWMPRRQRTPGSRRRRIGDRSAALRPLERLAALLGGRSTSLLCEELALRARLDFEQGRLAHAALELDRAYAAAMAELRLEARQDLAIRLAELEQLRAGVSEQAQAALPAQPGEAQTEPAEETVRHALERLEAALRARTAAGFSLKR